MTIHYFLMAYRKKTVIGVCYSYLSYLAQFKVCLMAQFSQSLFFIWEGWFPFLKRKWSLSFFPPLNSILWLYDLVTWSVALWINFMIKSISILILLQIKATHYAQNSTNSENTPKIHSIHAQYTQYIPIFEQKPFQCIMRVNIRKKKKKRLGSNLFK